MIAFDKPWAAVEWAVTLQLAMLRYVLQCSTHQTLARTCLHFDCVALCPCLPVVYESTQLSVLTLVQMCTKR